MTIDPEVRASEAARLLDNPLLMEVFDSIEDECIAAWDATGFDDQAKREKAWLMRKAVKRIRGNLLAIVDDGKIVARQLVQETMR